MFVAAYEQAVPKDRCHRAFNTHRLDGIQAEPPAAITSEPTTTPFFTGTINADSERPHGLIPISLSLF